MKTVKNETLYDTSTATSMTEAHNAENFGDWKTTELYRKNNGEYFAVVKNMSSSLVTFKSEEEAKQWSETNLSTHDYFCAFGVVSE